jgi:hypothetical protein
VVEWKVKFWPVGIHFFSRGQLKEMRLRLKKEMEKDGKELENRIIKVGEWVSLNNQGWVEGAIETVDNEFLKV